MSVAIVDRYEALPDELRKRIVPPRSCGVLGYDYSGDVFWVKSCDDVMSFYDSADAAVKEHCNLSIDDSVGQSYKVVKDCIISGNSFVRVKNDEKSLTMVCDAWDKWKTLDTKARNGSLTSFESYSYIAFHPLLWKPLDGNISLRWIVNEGHSNLSDFVIDDEIHYVLSLPNNHDLSVVVDKNNFDQVYVLMANELMNVTDF